MNTFRSRSPLNGHWQAALDPANSGLESGWQQQPPASSISISLPHTLDSAFQGFTGTVWYFCQFSAAAAPERALQLTLTGLGPKVDVFLNGKRLLTATSPYIPVTIPITAHLAKDTRNLLALRIEESRPPGTDAFRGFWGTAYIEDMPRKHLEEVRLLIEPRRKRIKVQASVPAGLALRLAAIDLGLSVRSESSEVSLELPDALQWAPQSPELLKLTLQLLDGEEVVDSLELRTGLRELSEKDGRFILNQSPFWLRAVQHVPSLPPDWSGSLRELFERELGTAREAGFHLIHCTTPPPAEFCALADELGILVAVDLSSIDPESIDDVVSAYLHHPSIAWWRLESSSEDRVAQLRTLDPSRLILWRNPVSLEARLCRPWQDEWHPYEDIRFRLSPPVTFEAEAYARHVGVPGRLNFVHGFGFTAPVLDVPAADPAWQVAANEVFESRELERAFGNAETMARSSRALQCDTARYAVDALRSNPLVSGYCFSQLCDGGNDLTGGILDRLRNPKPVLDTLKLVQRPVRPLIQMANTSLAPRAESPVTVLFANEARLDGRAEMLLLLVGPTNQVLWKKKRAARYPKHGKELWTGSVGASGSTGQHRLVVRLVDGGRITAEASQEFFVAPAVEPGKPRVHLLDPRKRWSARLPSLPLPEALLAPVHVIPPLANSIRAYPDQDLLQILAMVRGGAVAIFLQPPDDWADLARILDETLALNPRRANTPDTEAFHYAKLHPIFEGLPSRTFLRQAYRNIAPDTIFADRSDDDIAGSWLLPRAGAPVPEPSWGTDVVVRRYGSGRLVFLHYRLLEALEDDVVAARLLHNLIAYSERRAVPPSAPLQINAKAYEWLRRARSEEIRRWAIIGEFPNPLQQGHDTVYPPEVTVQLDQMYPGWYQVVRWQSHYATKNSEYTLNLDEILAPQGTSETSEHYGTAYAYAEFTSEHRHNAGIVLESPNLLKVWMNGNLVHADEANGDIRRARVADTFVKLGKNTLLVKCSRRPGPFQFRLDIEPPPREPMQLNWWK